jgi:hypothetical protein
MTNWQHPGSLLDRRKFIFVIAGSLSLSLPEVYLCHCRKFIFVIAGFSRQRNLDVREQNRKNAANVQNQDQDYAWI